MRTQRSIAVLLALLLAKSLLAHPAHETSAEMVWNATSKSLEVALKVRGVDLEAALTAKASKRVDLEETQGVDSRISEYLARCFTIESPAGKPIKIQFAGKAVSPHDVWLYFEFPIVTENAFGYSIANRVFFETLENQTNKVAFRSGSVRYTLVFDKDHPDSPASPWQAAIDDRWMEAAH